MARNPHPEVTIQRILTVSYTLFMEKGYENTTIQDIVDALGDLSKGAIYHHFKSKEAILDAATSCFQSNNTLFFEIIEKNNLLNGAQKLQKLLEASLDNPHVWDIFKNSPDILKNPKILALQFQSTQDEVVPLIQRLIEEGNADGSLNIKSPKETAGVMALLANFWANPAIIPGNRDDLIRRFHFVLNLFEHMGIPPFDENYMKKVEAFIDGYLDAINSR